MYVLGIWDGHDSGAAIVKDNVIVAAVNEERLSRRKLEVRFPEASIRYCLEAAHVVASDIRCVAVSTSDFAKTLTRVFPGLKEEYYQLRRRKKWPGLLGGIKKLAKYKLTEIPSSSPTRYISKWVIRGHLRAMGFTDFEFRFYDHHRCHAAAAAFCSGFDDCAVLTLDGIGDGLSGTVSVFDGGELRQIKAIPGDASFGIFYEHVTNLLNMRELEDEGKVLALATYACPVKDEDNPLIDFFWIEGISVRAKYGPIRMFRELKRVLWRYPSEQFAWLAQRTLEIKATELAMNVIKTTGKRALAVSGGVFSNIKLNMRLRELPEMDNFFVFPHMGDGGLALGAALCANQELDGISAYALEDLCLGPEYTDPEVEDILRRYGMPFDRVDNLTAETARIIAGGEIVFWFQGRMEYGPRALGHRSILALPASEIIKNRLNMDLKMRVWYQPFCPSIMEQDSGVLLAPHCGKPDRYMTMAYKVRPEALPHLKGVMGNDGTCRPQVVLEGEGLYSRLLLEVKKLTGIGALLNTSFNLHGDPLVCSPEDAVKTFLRTDCGYMVMHNFLVRKKYA